MDTINSFRGILKPGMLWPVTERQHSTRKLKFWITGCTNHKRFRKQHQYIIKNSFWGSDDFIIFKPGVGKRIPIPGLEKMNPNPNPKNFQIQSQSQSQSQNFKNSIPIPIPIPRNSWDPNPKNILMKNVFNRKKREIFWNPNKTPQNKFNFQFYGLFPV